MFVFRHDSEGLWLFVFQFFTFGSEPEYFFSFVAENWLYPSVVTGLFCRKYNNG